MALPVWMSNLIAYSLQIAILAAAGTLLAFLFRLKLPRWMLTYWQALLMACICLPALQPWNHATIGPAATGSASVAVRAPIGVAPANLSSAMQLPWEIIGLILLAGIVFKLMWLSLGFVRLRVFRRRSRVFLEENTAVRDLQRRIGTCVPLLLSGEIGSPVTFGFRSPAIILPLSWQNLSESCQRAIVCHELLHVRRRDWVVIIAEEIVGAIFWFHPAVWWLLNRIHLSREQAVDHEVVRLTGNKQPYLDSLLEFARAHERPSAVPAPLFLKESHLVQRVALLLKEVSMSRSRIAVSMISIILILMGTIYVAAGWFPLTGAPALAQEPNPAAAVKAPHTTPIQVAGDIQESKLIFKVEPVYPEEARRLGLNGIVRLRVTINEEGQVYRIVVQAGHPLLTKAAFDAVTQWRYNPTFLNGNPISVVTNVNCFFLSQETAAFGERTGDERRSADASPEIGPDTVVHVVADRRPTTPGWTGQSAQAQISGLQIKAPLREPIRVGQNVQESKLIRRVEPVYPDLARRARIQGTVRLTIIINEEGFVYELRGMEGNNPILETAAIDAVKQWQYSPTLLNGEPVPAQTTVTVMFSVE